MSKNNNSIKSKENSKDAIRRKKAENKKKLKLIIIAVIAIFAIIALIVFVPKLNGNDVKDDGNNDEQKVSLNDKKDTKYSKIKFSEMYEITNDEKKVSAIYNSYNGMGVELSGYMAVQSPLDESFIYLVNQPYVSCPFCAIGDITKLEIIPVFMADGSKIKYTENGVVIQGKLEVAEKMDSEGYTTQCRIYADNVKEISDENVDKELQVYYADLSEKWMIIDIQTLQMNIEYATNPTYMADYGITKAEIVNGIAGDNAEIMDYLKYIKECPEIVKGCEPAREDLIALNNELIDLYNKQIKVLEKFTTLIVEAQMAETTDDRKEEIYDSLVQLNQINLGLYEEFNSWNNRLRE